MVTTNDDELAERLRLLRNLAFGKPRFLHEEAGFNFRMTGYQAAMGRVQLRRIETIIEQKRRVAHTYNALAGRRRRASGRRSSWNGRATSTGCTRSRSTDEFPLTRDELRGGARERAASSRARSSAR